MLFAPCSPPHARIRRDGGDRQGPLGEGDADIAPGVGDGLHSSRCARGMREGRPRDTPTAKAACTGPTWYVVARLSGEGAFARPTQEQ